MRCTDCDQTFAVGNSCHCIAAGSPPVPETPSSDPAARGIPRDPGGGGLEPHLLDTHEGILRALNDLYDALDHCESGNDIKAIEAKLKVVKTKVEIQTKRETADALRAAEDADRRLEQRLAVAQGGAGRANSIQIPPFAGGVN